MGNNKNYIKEKRRQPTIFVINLENIMEIIKSSSRNNNTILRWQSTVRIGPSERKEDLQMILFVIESFRFAMIKIWGDFFYFHKILLFIHSSASFNINSSLPSTFVSVPRRSEWRTFELIKPVTSFATLIDDPKKCLSFQFSVCVCLSIRPHRLS